MPENNIYEAFDALTPHQKALFIDARLEWASGGALCGEVHTRICGPLKLDDKEENNS